jgi:hypothetical protein
MGLSRSEAIHLGSRLSSGHLTKWARAVCARARADFDRLKSRGVSKDFLKTTESICADVDEIEAKLEIAREAIPNATAELEKTHENALAWRKQAIMMAQVEFGTDPEMLARFRVGVSVGESVQKLVRELEVLLPLIREFIRNLSWLGCAELFLSTGETLAKTLRELDAKQETARNALPPETAEFYHKKGQLYDLARKLVGIGRLEFADEPDRAGKYGFDQMRKTKTQKKPARKGKRR